MAAVNQGMGEPDAAAHADFEKEVAAAMEQTPERLLFDLSDVGFMDSSGVHAILDVYRSRGMGDSVAVCGLSARLQRVFYLLGVTGRVGGIHTYATVDDALRARRDGM